jgi:hypothetical protein
MFEKMESFMIIPLHIYKTFFMFHEIIQLSKFSYIYKIPIKIQIMGEKWTIMNFHEYR